MSAGEASPSRPDPSGDKSDAGSVFLTGSARDLSDAALLMSATRTAHIAGRVNGREHRTRSTCPECGLVVSLVRCYAVRICDGGHTVRCESPDGHSGPHTATAGLGRPVFEWQS